MKSIIILSICLIMLAYGNGPQFGPKSVMKANGTPIKAGVPSPIMVDWDGDSKKDMLLGLMDSEGGGLAARVRVYINEGDHDDPQFGEYDFIKNTSGGILEATSW